MSRSLFSAVLLSLWGASSLFAQIPGAPQGLPPGGGSLAPVPPSQLKPNAFETNKPVAMPNKIVKPIPLSLDAQKNALANLDKQILEQTMSLNEKVKAILPDELAILAKTDGWKQEDQQQLVVALRAGDPTAVYEAWAKGNPKDTAGGEIAARQTEVKRLMARLLHDVEKNKAAVRQASSDLDASLGKIANSNPAVGDLSNAVKTIRTWADARFLIESVTPQKGPVAKIPTGNIALILDPSLPIGTAIVLNNQAMLIGHEGAGPLTITSGNAAQALGLPLVVADPIPDLEGDEIMDGTLVVNPKTSQGTVNYNINGTHYVMEPGMKQRLAANQKWVIEYDRGQNFGGAAYTLGSGSYWFTPTEQGWQLYKHRFDVVLDNSQSNQEFNVIFQGQNVTVPAASQRTLSSSYPIVLKFDRGNGAQFVTKAMPFSGNVQIGVSSLDNLWDMFPTIENRREAATNVKPFSAEESKKR
jgi:hypothetical protein